MWRGNIERSYGFLTRLGRQVRVPSMVLMSFRECRDETPNGQELVGSQSHLDLLWDCMSVDSPTRGEERPDRPAPNGIALAARRGFGPDSAAYPRRPGPVEAAPVVKVHSKWTLPAEVVPSMVTR